METNLEKSNHRVAVAVAAVVVMLPLLYALSIGPTVYIVIRTGMTNQSMPVAEAFYTPLRYVSNSTPLGPAIQVYVSWWRDLAQR